MGDITRNDFLSLSGFSAIPVVPVSGQRNEAKRKPFKRKSPNDLIEVGLVVAQGCHSFNGIWGDILNPPEKKIRTTGMVIKKIWSYRKEFAKRFTDRYPEVEAVKDIEDLVGTVDGVYVDAFTAVSLYHLISKPFLLAGMPTFINRPFCTSIEKGKMIIENAEKGGAPLMSNSTWEFSECVGDLQDKAFRMPNILGYAAHNSMSDYYTHGVHGVYFIASIFRNERKRGRGRCLAAAYLTPDWRIPPGAVSYIHENSTGKPFYGQLHLQGGMDANAYMRLFGDHSGDFEGKIPARPGWFQYNTWNALQLVIQEMIETRKTPESGEDILEKTYMFLMGFKSVLEKNGSPVTRDEVENWECPPPLASMKRGKEPTASGFLEPYSEEELKALEKYLS